MSRGRKNIKGAVLFLLGVLLFITALSKKVHFLDKKYSDNELTFQFWGGIGFMIVGAIMIEFKVDDETFNLMTIFNSLNIFK